MTFNIQHWLIWTFVLCFLLTIRNEITVTDDRHERCHPTFYIETTVWETNILWFSVTHSKSHRTVRNTWGDQ